MKNFRTIISIILTFCIIVAIGTEAYASEYKGEVAVGPKYGSNAGSSVVLLSPGGLTVYNATDGTVLYEEQAGAELNIQMGSVGFSSWNKFDASTISKITVHPTQGGTLVCDGKGYRGYIYMECRANGELLVINYVNTEDYVSSVLGKEMSYSWPKEALKAQAVCARNYVLTRGGVHKEYGFDVCTTTHCQVYGGVASEHENTRRAVSETAGVLGTYNGKLVGLYFFATSGGQTEDVENVWGTHYGYLRSVPDTYENPEKASKYKWETKLTRTEIEQKLEKAGAKIGTLTNIRIDSTSDSGRVTKMTFCGTDGEYSVKNEKCRTTLGLYSQKFSVVADGEDSVKTTHGEAGGALYAQSADGVAGVAGYYALGANGVLQTIPVRTEGAESYTFNGGGYGHGVGMSQWGARGMAENGFTYDQILKHYFTDLELG